LLPPRVKSSALAFMKAPATTGDGRPRFVQILLRQSFNSSPFPPSLSPSSTQPSTPPVTLPSRRSWPEHLFLVPPYVPLSNARIGTILRASRPLISPPRDPAGRALLPQEMLRIASTSSGRNHGSCAFSPSALAPHLQIKRGLTIVLAIRGDLEGDGQQPNLILSLLYAIEFSTTRLRACPL